MRFRLGYKIRQIEALTGVPKSTVGNIVKRWRQERRVDDKPRSGRPRLLSNQETHQLDQIIKADREASGRLIAQRLRERTGKGVSKRLANLYRRRLGYHGRLRRNKHQLTILQKLNRLNWARRHLHSNWDDYVFLDEHIFTLAGRGGLVWVKEGEPVERGWRPGSRHPPHINCIGAISKNGVCGLVFFTGTLISSSFTKMMRKHILPVMRRKHGRRAKLVLDNDSKHKSNHTRNWIEEEGVVCYYLPAWSPDLNPIEKIWAYLDNIIAQKRPSDLEELQNCVRDSWQQLTPAKIGKLIRKLNTICDTILSVNGGATKY